MLLLTVEFVTAFDSYPETDGYFPFFIPFTETLANEVALRELNHIPAGKYGFIHKEKDGHLYAGHQRVKFVGTQMFWNDPPESISPLIATKFQALGFNIWKWGSFEKFWHDGFLSQKWHRKIRRFDYLFYSMKLKGIYYYGELDEYSLIVAAKVSERAKDYYALEYVDSFPDDPSSYKGIQYVMEPKLFQAQKKYWKDILCRKNSFTGLKYVDNPALAVLEITNENMLLSLWEYRRVPVDKWPERFRALFRHKWNKWLLDKYGTLEDIRRAWEQEGKIGLREEELGWNVEVEPITIKDSRFSDRRREDFARFLYDLQVVYLDSCINYLRSIGVKCLIVAGNGTTLSLPDIHYLARADILDTHTYFDHPDRLGVDGSIKNINPFKTYSTLISAVAANSVLNLPVSISETNWAYPNYYQYLFLPFLACYSTFQDWDVIILHAYCGRGTYKKGYIEQQLIFGLNPLILVQLPGTSLIFRKGYVSTDSITYILYYDNVWQDYLSNYARRYYLPAKKKLKASNFIPLVFRFRKYFGEAINQDDVRNLEWFSGYSCYINTTGELVFDRKNELFTADNKFVKIACGMLGGKKVELRGVTIVCSRKRQYGCVSLVPLDDRPICESKRLLLTVVSEVKNLGFEWDIRGKKFRKWGTGPVMVNTLDCKVIIDDSFQKVEIWALDPTGRKKRRLNDIKSLPNGLWFKVDGRYRSLWYIIYKE